jgi:secreted trypsin-like serine protease
MAVLHPTEVQDFESNKTAVAIVQSINNESSVICSGTPLAKDIILTAAHCLPTGNPQNSVTPAARLSVLTLNSLEDDFKKIDRWVVHPDYKRQPIPKQEDFDLALIQTKVTRPSKESGPSQYFQTASIGTNSDMLVWISGFSPKRIGLTNPREIIRSSAKWSNVKVLMRIPSEGKFLAVAKNPKHAGACAGDSGAPVWTFANGRALLSGLVVQANCEKGQVKIVDLAKYSDWIARATRSLNEALTIQ